MRLLREVFLEVFKSASVYFMVLKSIIARADFSSSASVRPCDDPDLQLHECFHHHSDRSLRRTDYLSAALESLTCHYFSIKLLQKFIS